MYGTVGFVNGRAVIVRHGIYFGFWIKTHRLLFAFRVTRSARGVDLRDFVIASDAEGASLTPRQSWSKVIFEIIARITIT